MAKLKTFVIYIIIFLKMNERAISPTEEWSDIVLTEKEMQMALKCIKRCSISLIIRERQIKTTLRCHFNPSLWPKFQ